MENIYDEETIADDGDAAFAATETLEVEVDKAVLTGSNLGFFGTPFPGFFVFLCVV